MRIHHLLLFQITLKGNRCLTINYNDRGPLVVLMINKLHRSRYLREPHAGLQEVHRSSLFPGKYNTRSHDSVSPIIQTGRSRGRRPGTTRVFLTCVKIFRRLSVARVLVARRTRIGSHLADRACENSTALGCAWLNSWPRARARTSEQ